MSASPKVGSTTLIMVSVACVVASMACTGNSPSVARLSTATSTRASIEFDGDNGFDPSVAAMEIETESTCPS